MDQHRRLDCREGELAIGYARASSKLANAKTGLRKIGALVQRDDPSPVIAQRIVGADPEVNEPITQILKSLSFRKDDRPPSIGETLELYGWPVVREIMIMSLLHQVHCELVDGQPCDPATFDCEAVATLTAAALLGEDSIAAFLLNIGEVAMVALGGKAYLELKATHGKDRDALLFEETCMFGFDHAYLGTAMLMDSDLPPPICQAILEHPSVNSPFRLVELFVTASNIASPQDDLTLGADQPLTDRLRLSPQKALKLKNVVRASTKLPDSLYRRAFLAA